VCRSIKVLRQGSNVATAEEIEAAALQFVRKVSGFRKPTARHQEAFDEAVDEITRSASALLDKISLTLR